MVKKQLKRHVDYVIIGKRIYERRRELKLTQQKLGNMLGITPAQVQKYENGTTAITLDRLYELCIALKLTPVELAGAEILLGCGNKKKAQTLVGLSRMHQNTADFILNLLGLEPSDSLPTNQIA